MNARSWVPQITPIPRELSAENVREIIQIAERAQARRSELAREIRTALAAGDTDRVLMLARQFAEREGPQREQAAK
jgi:hypothetical protein